MISLAWAILDSEVLGCIMTRTVASDRPEFSGHVAVCV